MRSIFLPLSLVLAFQARAASDPANGNNHFAFDLYHKLPQNKNIFFSPYSISSALAMTYAGAKTGTAAEMEKVLHITDPENFHTGFGKLMSDINALNGKDVKMSIANRLFGATKFKFLETYLKQVNDVYKAPVERLDFSGKTEESRKHINQWVEKQTNNKIRELLQQGVITSTTKLVLVNAIYFYGDWASQFEENVTSTGKFYLDAQKSVDAKLMYQQKYFEYASGKNFQALRIPYKGNGVSMEIYLPNEKNGLAEWEKTLDDKSYSEWKNLFKRHKVNFTLPKFKMTSSFTLADILKTLGMKTAFTNAADFSGMTGKKDLCISQVVHKAFIDVGEKGTEAAAATAVVMEPTSAHIDHDLEEIKTFKADHPFFFLIRENKTGTILFMGRMLEPSKA